VRRVRPGVPDAEFRGNALGTALGQCPVPVRVPFVRSDSRYGHRTAYEERTSRPRVAGGGPRWWWRGALERRAVGCGAAALLDPSPVDHARVGSAVSKTPTAPSAQCRMAPAPFGP